MQLQDLDPHYQEALSLHTLLRQIGFLHNQLFFVPEHRNVGITLVQNGQQYQFNCAYLQSCYRREDVIAGWPQAVEIWYGPKYEKDFSEEQRATFEYDRAQLERERWDLVFASTIFTRLEAVLAVLESRLLLPKSKDVCRTYITKMRKGQ